VFGFLSFHFGFFLVNRTELKEPQGLNSNMGFPTGGYQTELKEPCGAPPHAQPLFRFYSNIGNLAGEFTALWSLLINSVSFCTGFSSTVTAIQTKSLFTTEPFRQVI
jgi:hypothetical protein